MWYTARMADDLYEADFFAWTRAQSDALRSRKAGRNQLDYDRLAEEVDDLGAAQKNKASSLVRLIIVHLLKLEFSRSDQPRGHWRGEIGNFRADLAPLVSGSIRRLLEDELEDLHQRATRIARDQFRDYEPATIIPDDRRWSLPEILGEHDDPLNVEAHLH